MKKYYLAGPMTGLPGFNFPRFDEVAKILRDRGFEIASAHEVDHGEAPGATGLLPHHVYVKGDLKVMLECDAVIFLENWETSRGCQTEFTVAGATGMEVYNFCGCSVMIHQTF